MLLKVLNAFRILGTSSLGISKQGGSQGQECSQKESQILAAGNSISMHGNGNCQGPIDRAVAATAIEYTEKEKYQN